VKLIHRGNKGNVYLSDGVIYKTGPVEKEYNILRRLDHPNIIKVFDLSTDGEKPCMTMEYFNGYHLLHPDYKELEQLKSAVYYIHSQGYKHNDLMAYNVLTDGETVKVIDFGNAGDINLLAKDVEGCKREDLRMLELYEIECDKGVLI